MLLTFNRLKALSTDKAVVAAALEGSPFIKLSDDKQSIARHRPWNKDSSDDGEAATIYVEHVPAEVTIEQINALLAVYGEIKIVNVVRNRERQCRGYCFVEFATAEQAAAALAALPTKDAAAFYASMVSAVLDTKQVRCLSLAEWKKRKAPRADADGAAKKKRKAEGEADADATEASAAQPHSVRVPNCLVELNNIGAEGEITPRSLRTDVSAIVLCKYVDWEAGAKGLARFGSAAETQTFLDKVAAGHVKLGSQVITARLLTEEEQTKYWADVEAKAPAASSHGGRGGGRGRGRGGSRGGRDDKRHKAQAE